MSPIASIVSTTYDAFHAIDVIGDFLDNVIDGGSFVQVVGVGYMLAFA